MNALVRDTALHDVGGARYADGLLTQAEPHAVRQGLHGLGFSYELHRVLDVSSSDFIELVRRAVLGVSEDVADDLHEGWEGVDIYGSGVVLRHVCRADALQVTAVLTIIHVHIIHHGRATAKGGHVVFPRLGKIDCIRSPPIGLLIGDARRR